MSEKQPRYSSWGENSREWDGSGIDERNVETELADRRSNLGPDQSRTDNGHPRRGSQIYSQRRVVVEIAQVMDTGKIPSGRVESSGPCAGGEQ